MTEAANTVNRPFDYHPFVQSAIRRSTISPWLVVDKSGRIRNSSAAAKDLPR